MADAGGLRSRTRRRQVNTSRATAVAGRHQLAAILAAVVVVEVAVLAASHWRCPLTGVAARYTNDRSGSFDIYLPLWLARCNKPIFGTLFVMGVAVALCAWLRSL